MKFITRMILVFSVMIFLVMAVNTIHLSQTNLDGAAAFTKNRYKNMGTNMVKALEQYVSLMDLAISDITSDTAFMNAMYQVVHADENASTAAQQSIMLQKLVRSPICDAFYRVSVYNEQGFYISNSLSSGWGVTSMTEESLEKIQRVHYLSAVKAAPYRRHLIAPHEDCFSHSNQETIFSAVHAITWHGEHLGYIEIAALSSELDTIFPVDDENVHVQAILPNGDVLMASAEDTAVYIDVPLNEFMLYTDPTGLKRHVYHVQSRSLGVNIHIASDTAIISANNWKLIVEYIHYAAIIAAVSLLVIVFISLSMTHSIRKMQNRIRNLRINDADSMLIPDTASLSEHAISTGEKDLYQLESSFNHLLLALHDATGNEITLRESSLRSHLVALQTQINPHFVYNTLNIIAAKGMESGNEEIVDMCSQFAGMLRYSTDTHSESATLREDLDHVENYLSLLKARFEDQLVFVIDVPDKMLDMRIPKLTLQPLVENAMTHGFDRQMQDVRRIGICGTMDEDKMVLEIRDNGRGFAPDVLSQLRADMEIIRNNPYTLPEVQGHIGLLNTYMRLHFYSKGTMGISLQNDCGAVVRLTFDLK